MSEWREVSLAEIGAPSKHAFSTGPFGSAIASKYFEDSGVPVIRGSNLSTGVGQRLITNSFAFVSDEKAGEHQRSIATAGDLVFTCWGTVGQVGYLDGQYEFERFLLSNKQMKMTPDPCVVDPLFLYYLLSSPEMIHSVQSRAIGAAVPGFNLGQLKELRVRFPALPTQRRIAAVLSAFDDLIEINERRIELLESLVRSIYNEWFVRLRLPGRPLPPDGALGLPHDWEQLPLNEVVDTQYGLTASADPDADGPRLLRGMDINKRSFIRWPDVPACVATMADAQKFRLEVNDVCVIRMADPGKVGIVEQEVPGGAVFASYLVRLRSRDSRLSPYLLFSFLDSPEYQDWITGSSTGATRKSASAAVLTEPAVRLPTPEFAARFETVARTIRAELTRLVEANATLSSTRDLLLPRLVTGRLDIEDIDLGDPLSEPAAA